MTVEQIQALTAFVHELAPWAAVVAALIAAWQAKRASDHSKVNTLIGSDTSAKLDENTAITRQAAAKVEELQNVVSEQSIRGRKAP